MEHDGSRSNTLPLLQRTALISIIFIFLLISGYVVSPVYFSQMDGLSAETSHLYSETEAKSDKAPPKSSDSKHDGEQEGEDSRIKVLKERDEAFLDFVNMKADASSKKYHRLPGLISIGVEKCGTGALACMLENHPMLKSFPIREAHYFDKPERYAKGITAYLRFLPLVTDYEIPMEKSPSYFRLEKIPQRMKKDVPDAKIYVVLCDPVNRTFSDFVQESWTGRLSNTIEYDDFITNAIQNLETGLKEVEENETAVSQLMKSSVEETYANSVVTQGLYYYHLKRWFQTYNQSDILVLDGEEIITEPWKPVEQIQNFLKIPVFLTKENFVRNPLTGFYSSRPLVAVNSSQGTRVEYGEATCVKMNNKRRTRLGSWTHSTETKGVKRVREFYSKYNEKLYALLGRRFNWQ